MTKQELNKLVAMYIVGIGTNGIPNSHLWMAIDKQMADLDRHTRLLGALIDGGLVKESNHFLTLTEKGLEMNKKLEELYMPKVVEPAKAPL